MPRFGRTHQVVTKALPNTTVRPYRCLCLRVYWVRFTRRKAEEVGKFRVEIIEVATRAGGGRGSVGSERAWLTLQ